ncbi:YdiU family protein [Luteolibacter sp. SL250]|uniref:protein adenylyltransferase SelO n=1 Tax=Luteolibacter sp. SL250 TaxID=2995170 RepID=UPI00226E1D8B|nr:YdiU family protein [Luteolibacter sp. SL250]WAC18801.1 YdiU family protein [Luteolibacter sp. SL250]
MSSPESAPADPSTPSGPGGWRLEHTYAALPEDLHQSILPTPVEAPELVILNRPLAIALGLDPDALAENATDFLSGNVPPPGAAPLAQAYAGHQYGNFTNLGDGRAILLGEQIAPDGNRHDIQLKGPGRTRYSRGGDGRAALGPMLREYLISEAMQALGIPTTRSLAVVATGEAVHRQDGPLPGAVLTRTAASHIRVGTFQYVAATEDRTALLALTRYTLARHFPEKVGAANPALALLDGVVERQADLIARWMMVGFVHGVMNTDNMVLSGETIDYGPCAFMDTYDPATVFSSIDRRGRYAYANQPSIAGWNLARFAEAILPLIHEEQTDAINLATGSIHGFQPRYQDQWLAGMRGKLGLFGAEEDDLSLIHALLQWMADAGQDFTNTFAALSTADTHLSTDDAFTTWHTAWQARLTRQPQTLDESIALRAASNPAVIPRNHLVEHALAAATTDGDLQPFHALLEVISNPFAHGQVPELYRTPPPADGERYVTYCGT